MSFDNQQQDSLHQELDQKQALLTDILDKEMSESVKQIYTEQVDRFQETLKKADLTPDSMDEREKMLYDLIIFFDTKIMPQLEPFAPIETDEIAKKLQQELQRLESEIIKKGPKYTQTDKDKLLKEGFAADIVEQYGDLITRMSKHCDIGQMKNNKSFFDKHEKTLKILFIGTTNYLPLPSQINDFLFDGGLEQYGEKIAETIQSSNGDFDLFDFFDFAPLKDFNANNLDTLGSYVKALEIICETCGSYSRETLREIIYGFGGNKDWVSWDSLQKQISTHQNELLRLRYKLEYLSQETNIESYILGKQFGELISHIEDLYSKESNRDRSIYNVLQALEDPQKRQLIIQYLKMTLAYSEQHDWFDEFVSSFRARPLGEINNLLDQSSQKGAPPLKKIYELLCLAGNNGNPTFINNLNNFEQIYKNRKKIQELITIFKGDFSDVTHLPLDLLETHQNELMEVARMFKPATAKAILFRIHVEDDLDFVLKNKELFTKIESETIAGFSRIADVKKNLKVWPEAWEFAISKMPSIGFLMKNGDMYLSLLRKFIPYDNRGSYDQGSEAFLRLTENDDFIEKHGATILEIFKITKGSLSLQNTINYLKSIKDLLSDNKDFIKQILSYTSKNSKATLWILQQFDSQTLNNPNVKKILLALAKKLGILPEDSIQKMPWELADNYSDQLIEMGAKNDALNISFLDFLKKEWKSFPDLKSAMALLKKYPQMNSFLFRMLPYFQYVQYPQDKIDEIFNKTKIESLPEDTLIKYVRYDYRSGHPVDLLKFDLSEQDAYSKLFYTYKTGQVSGEMEFINAMSFDDFSEKMKDMDMLKLQQTISYIEANIHPVIADRLYSKLLAKAINKEGWLSGILTKWYNPKRKKIDVTQNNINQVNSLLKLLITVLNKNEPADISKEVRKIFPACPCTGDFSKDVLWLAEQFDVEEINFKKLQGFDSLANYMVLLGNMDELHNKAAKRYLNNKFQDIDIIQLFEGTGKKLDVVCCDMKTIEDMRLMLNAKNRLAGDQFIDRFGMQFLEKNIPTFDSLNILIRFAKAWSVPEKTVENKDVHGLYQQYAFFAYDLITSFLREQLTKLGHDKLNGKLAEKGINFETLSKELDSAGFPIGEEESYATKVRKRIFTHPSYVFQKGRQKIFGQENIEIEGQKLSIKEDKELSRDGVKVYEITINGKEVAKIIKCNRGTIKAKVLAERSGKVDMQKEAKELNDKLVFSAPVNMTTGDHKMTELAFKSGIAINWLLSPQSKDGFILVNEEGNSKILNKKKLKISDFINVEDLQNPGIKATIEHWLILNNKPTTNLTATLNEQFQPSLKFYDKSLFFKLMSIKKYSLLCGMLLIEEGQIQSVNDASDSRRFFVEFDDGSFGVMDSTVDLSTNRMSELSVLAGVTKAVYMDTGMYDKASYKDGHGNDITLGHQDTDESTNRIVLFSI